MKRIRLGNYLYAIEEIKALNVPEPFKDAAVLMKKWVEGENEFAFKTSGSTGVPKVIIFTRSQIEASINRTVYELSLNPSDHFLCCLSVLSVAGAMMVLRALVINAELTIVIPNSEPLKDISESHAFTVASFVPLQLHSLLFSGEDRIKLNRFKVVLVGGAAISYALEKLLAHSDASIYETYGMTETISHVALRKVGKEDAFHLLPGLTMKLDEHNCFCVKGDVTNDEWVITNDLTQLLDINHFLIKGRTDRVINTGGVKVHAEKIEAVIGEWYPDLIFFVEGIPDDRFGQNVVLFIEGEHKLTIEILKMQLDGLLTTYEIPRQIKSVQTFDRTDSGKVDRLRTLQKMSE
jgi:O-succinylbenzoic acid--CoA ligase